MCIRNTFTRYGSVAQSLHWLIFALFVAIVTLALIMTDMAPSPDKWELYGLHKSLGMIVLLLALLRLSWRMVNPTPEMAATLKPWEKKAARAAHWLLYVLMFGMPLTGYIMSMGGGHGVSVFGVVLPNLIGENKPLAGIAHELHEMGEWAIYGLVGVHAAAALRHHFILKDDTLRKMLPSWLGGIKR